MAVTVKRKIFIGFEPTEVKEAKKVKEVKEVKEAYVPRPARVYVVKYRMRHPVTGVMFEPGVPVDIIDLNHVDNIFVRHQLEAGVFKEVKNDT